MGLIEIISAERELNQSYRLRPATLEDAERLFVWRNDPATRTASHNAGELDWNTHVDWLKRSLEDPNRQLMIALCEDVPVGTVRADKADGMWKLSWTVAPESRGRGIGSAIVKLAVEHVNGAILAEIKAGNSASARIAENAGLKFLGEKNGVMHFARGPVSSTEIE